jgi:hypothetical protein
MKNNHDALKREMLDKIKNGGAWFCTRENNYVKIAYSETDNCLYARECFIKEDGLEGGAYTFGMDWFDISFHGKYIDIYADADSFKSWNVWYDSEKGTCYKAEDRVREMAKRVMQFCKQADQEALSGDIAPYKIDGTNFDKIIEMSQTSLKE